MAVPKVTIIGASYAGLAVFKELDKLGTGIEITVIDPKDGFLHVVAGVRTTVQPTLANDIWWPYTTTLMKPTTNRHFIQGHATSLTSTSVIITKSDSTTQTTEFDYCVIATGSSYHMPAKTSATTKEEYVAQAAAIASSIKDARTILIVGGGPVGVEIAGEIATDYKDKKVVLVHSGSELIPGPTSEKFKSKVLTKIRSLGVQVILNDKIPLSVFNGQTFGSTPQTIETTNGIKIESDVQIIATGNASYNGTFVKSLSPDLLTETNQLKVLPTLQLPSYPHIFAAGDITSGILNVAFFAGMQGTTVGSNIAKLIKKDQKLGVFKGPPFTAMLVAAGRKGGVAQMGWFVLGDGVSKSMKSGDLLVGKTRSEVGVQ